MFLHQQFPHKFLKDGTKYCRCPYCKREWLIGRRGGGMVYQAAIRHTHACEKKHPEQYQAWVDKLLELHPEFKEQGDE